MSKETGQRFTLVNHCIFMKIYSQSGTRKCLLPVITSGTKVSVLIVYFTIIMIAGKSTPPQNTLQVNPLNRNKDEYTRQTFALATSIAHFKAKKRLLTEYGDLNMFSSLRPKIGKRFSDVALEERRMSVCYVFFLTFFYS